MAEGIKASGRIVKVAGPVVDAEFPHEELPEILNAIEIEFELGGETQRVIAEVAGPVLLEDLRAEEKRMAEGWTYEPPTFYEINAPCRQQFADEYADVDSCRFVEPMAKSTLGKCTKPTPATV